MPIRRHDATVTALYAELFDQLLALEAQRSIAHLSGGFTGKTIKGRRYWYFQYRELGQTVRQVYVGPDTEAIRRLVERFESGKAALEPDRARLEQLCAMLRRAGMMVTDVAAFRVLQALGDSGLFRQGSILVGTHAFAAIGNLLGVRWMHPAAQTRDVDLAKVTDLELALPSGEEVDLPEVLARLEMGFLPVPGLNPKHPSTAFKVRGKELRLDLLTPAHRGRRKPVYFPALNAAAQPLPFLDYLVAYPERAAVIGRSAVLVNVPDPARFAFHKVLASQVRAAAFHAKSRKDLDQAAELFEVLLQDRPADLRSAWADLVGRGRRWRDHTMRGLKQLAREHEGLIRHLRQGLE